MKRFLLIFSLLCARSFAVNSEPTDLGNDLSYLRVRSLVESSPHLRSMLSADHALVLDLRYAAANEESTVELRAALALHPATVPLFILISPSTPAAVVDAINQTPGAFITLGITNSRSARVEVKAGATTDRRAYDALEAGTPVDVLISGKIEKERFDEATLVQEFKNGNHDAEPPPLPDPTAPQTRTAPEPALSHGSPLAVSVASPAEPSMIERPAMPVAGAIEPSQAERLIDHVLQRAVHLHQALLALKSRS